MASGKEIRIHNKSDKPDNIVRREHETLLKCEDIQRQLPGFLKGFFAYLKGNVLPMTRLAYLNDIRFFCRYLVEETDITDATEISDINISDFNKIKAKDINSFIEYCRKYTVEKDDEIIVYENGSKTLARKKSSLSVLFKQLYRDELIDKNITDGFDPIRVPKAGEREIKALQDDEVMITIIATGFESPEENPSFYQAPRSMLNPMRQEDMRRVDSMYGFNSEESKPAKPEPQAYRDAPSAKDVPPFLQRLRDKK